MRGDCQSTMGPPRVDMRQHPASMHNTPHNSSPPGALQHQVPGRGQKGAQARGAPAHRQKLGVSVDNVQDRGRDGAKGGRTAPELAPQQRRHTQAGRGAHDEGFDQHVVAVSVAPHVHRYAILGKG